MRLGPTGSEPSGFLTFLHQSIAVAGPRGRTRNLLAAFWVIIRTRVTFDGQSGVNHTVISE